MNYLAHLLLSEAEEQIILGNLLGDFVKGSAQGRYPESVVRGIQFHRRIDQFTDQHPEFLAAKQAFAPPLRKFSGILLDLMFDHLLCRHWQQFAPASELWVSPVWAIEDLTERAYEVMQNHQPLLPERLQRALPAMRSADLFASYQRWSGIEYAISRIAARLKRGTLLAEQGADALKAEEQRIEGHFLLFYPQLQRFAEQLKRESF